jgi:beta-aspartyl-peptidase (threonine type)
MNYSIAIHGGAGTILKSEMTNKQEEDYQDALNEALTAGYEILDKGGSSLDAVEIAVTYLENCPLFNAGKGSVFTNKGTHEMDASIMNGVDQSAGAVAMLHAVKNPINLARLVMEKTSHVLLAGQGAMDFANQMKVEMQNDDYFF